MSQAFLRRLLDDASQPFRSSGRFAYHYARGKLGGDGVFRALLERGIFPAEGHYLDLGCGQGCLFSWLLAARARYEKGDWPSHWPAAPKPLSLRGYELMAKDVERAGQAFGKRCPMVDIRLGDMREADFGFADVVTILDALHYIDYVQQEDVLRRIRAALPARGLFVTRIGDAGAGLPYRLSNWVDHAVVFARGHRLPKLYGRRLGEWVGLLQALGFVVDSAPMSDGKPFANTLLVCRLPA